MQSSNFLKKMRGKYGLTLSFFFDRIILGIRYSARIIYLFII
jgi:hypothetical protein